MREFPERFFASENMHGLAEPARSSRGTRGKVDGLHKRPEDVTGGKSPVDEATILRRVEDGLAEEIKLMLDESVVAAPEDIDLCLILGAGWPFQAGGATPYLDRVGASERVFGETFHDPQIRGVGQVARSATQGAGHRQVARPLRCLPPRRGASRPPRPAARGRPASPAAWTSPARSPS